MIKEIRKAVKDRLISFLRVRHKTPTIFNFTTEGERYTKHYPSVSYNVYVSELNPDDYYYNVVETVIDATHPSGYISSVNAVRSGLGAIQTRTFPRTGGEAAYTNTGYSSVVIFPVQPFNVTVEITTRAKTEDDDNELCESILRNIGQYNKLVVSSWDGDRYHYLDMELEDQTDLTGLYRRLEGKQRLFERQFVYNVEGWLEGDQSTLTTVTSRSFEYYKVDYHTTTTGFEYTTSGLAGTWSPDE